jgi:dCTP diphosphatase
MKDIINQLIKFRDARGWQKYHTEPELARSVSIESAELNELYQWGQRPAAWDLSDELADVMIYCLLICEQRGFDPEQIILQKIAKNELKYPANQDHGKEKGWK